MGARCFARHSIEDKPLSKMKKNSIYKIVPCRALYSGKAFPFYRGKIHGDKTNKSPSFPKLSHFVIFRILIALSLIFREIHGNPIQLPGVLGELKAMPSLEQQNMVAFHIWSRGATEKNTYITCLGKMPQILSAPHKWITFWLTSFTEISSPWPHRWSPVTFYIPRFVFCPMACMGGCPGTSS